jgi:tight adherence protein C
MADVILQILAFFLVCGLTLAGQRALGAHLAVRRRLGREAPAPRLDTPSVLKSQGVTNRALLWVQTATAPKDPQETNKLRRDLALAGFESPAAPIWYVICRFSLAVGLPLLLIIGAGAAGKPVSGLGAVVLPVMLCGLGLLSPNFFVRRRATARRMQVEHEFPDALDLMIVCVEAGLGLEAAFVRVAREVVESHPRIAEEFGRLAEELAAGRSRADALRALAARVDVESINAFVALLIQSDALGVSIAQGLRTYSTEMREARFLKAEEKAMRIPVLLTVPIVACFMPVVVVALLLPPAIDLVRTLQPALQARHAPAANTTIQQPRSVP